MSENKFERGSEWRKWDLHVHSPESYNFTGDWNQFKKQLLNADCAVIGINDYFSVAGYKKIQNEIAEGSLNIGNKFILPVVEMRMTDALQPKSTNTNRGTHFNFHIIFSDKLQVDDIENFIKSLDIGSTSISTDYGNKQKLKDIKVSYFETLKILDNDSKFKDKFLIWLPYDEYGGISEINPDSDRWIKEEYTKKSHIIGSSNKKESDFFLWKSPLDKNEAPKFSQQQFEKWFGVKKPCIKGSDSHSHTYPIGKLKDKNSRSSEKYCWIKADPTFEGLEQIKYEPEERVYIGERPPILDKVENNKIKYINSLEIKQANENHNADTWFKDISIPFNKELVAIIGNKGSGKSAIADILGLAGDTSTDRKYFSFLHKNKFLNGKLAEKFKAQIVWESNGKSEEILLNALPKTENPESVRFIPQNYFEELTNIIEINNFRQVLEKIIFEYIPRNEKLNQNSFTDLEKFKTETLDNFIRDIKNKIQFINREIIDLETKNNPEYLKKIKGYIDSKNRELIEQRDLLKGLPKIIDPTENDSAEKKQVHDSIKEDRVKLQKLNSDLNEKEKEKADLTLKVEELKQLKEAIEQQRQSLETFKEYHSARATKHALDLSKILKVEVDYSAIDKLISNYASDQALMDTTYFESYASVENRGAQNDNKSIIYKIKVLEMNLVKQQQNLTKEQAAFQKNVQRRREIEEKIKELTGDSESPAPGTLNFYQKEKTFIDKDLVAALQEKRDTRIKKSLEIFKKKNEIIDLYNTFKKSVDYEIQQNEGLLEGYDIKIDSSFLLDTGFCDQFLDYINQNRTGCFYGTEKGTAKINSIVEDNGFSDEEKVRKFLESIIQNLEKDEAIISNQVKNDKLDIFYDYVFSLNYINPKYELKLGAKTLSQLSPGERGSLLLIFHLMIDKSEIPLVIDQPEDNLDNESVYTMLSKFIKQAKRKRQIVIVTHNPNLAVGADAEQIIYVKIDKMKKNKFSFVSGSIENQEINKEIVRVLEGTKPAFDKRRLKYQGH